MTLDIREQTKAVIENIAVILKSAGAGIKERDREEGRGEAIVKRGEGRGKTTESEYIYREERGARILIPLFFSFLLFSF